MVLVSLRAGAFAQRALDTFTHASDGHSASGRGRGMGLRGKERL